jgi:radical SAM protein with 4Fe4S-binding SPASM domain
MAPAFVSGMLNGIRRGASAAFWRALPSVDREIFELRPSHLTLEFTNLCNANCVFCPYSQQTRPHERMSDEVFRKAVSDYVAIGGGSVDLTPIVGDPLIHPKFLEWVRYLRSRPEIDRITVTTNGILLSKHGIDEILDSGLSRINISMAGFDREMYRRIYRTDAYRKVFSNVEKLLAANARRDKRIPIFLCLRPDRPQSEVLASPDFRKLLPYNPRVSFAGILSRSGGQIEGLPDGMALADLPASPKSTPCIATYFGLAVQSRGDVQVCACESSVNAPALVIGNILSESLADIWRGERMRALRRSFTDGTLNPNCAKCDVYFRPADFRTREMRAFAKSSRRRSGGEIVRHGTPVAKVWQME